MQKFTIFTIMLTIIIIVIVSEIVVNEYLPSIDEDGNSENYSLNLPESLDTTKGIQTNILGADFDSSYLNKNTLMLEKRLNIVM